MQQTKNKVKRKATIKKYSMGYFVDGDQIPDDGSSPSWISNPKNQQGIAAGAGVVGGALNMFQPVNGDTNTGLSAASGALTGAATGYKTAGVIGAGVGLVAGGVAGLISGHAKHEQYERQQNLNTQNQFFNTERNMTTTNVDPYGNQMAYGDLVPNTGDPIKVTPSKKPVATVNNSVDFPAPGDPYWKSHPLVTEHSDGTLRLWGENPVFPNSPSPTYTNESQGVINNPNINPSIVTPSDKMNSNSNTYYPSANQMKGTTPATVHSNSYANGASVGLSGKAAGKFYVPNAGLRRFAPHMQRIGKINPLPSSNIDFNSSSQNSPQNMETGDSVMPTNSQQNMINIQKGELLINPQDGKILQDYHGINPLTGGMFEPHAKDKQQESPNNFTMADPGLFVITKKTAGQYKEAMDNNDKISQKTVLMNIRNAKIAKEGGLRPQGNYADGDQVTDYPWSYNNWSKMARVPSDNISTSTPIQGTPTNTPVMSNVDPYLNHQRALNDATPTPSNQSNGSNWGDGITKYGPAAINIAEGLFGKTNHLGYANPISNPYANNVIANMPKNVNMNPIISDIYSNQNVANKNLENNVNSSAVYRANRQNLGVSTNKALIGARLQADELNNQAAGQRSYMYNALGYQNQQEQEKERDYNLGIDEINNRRDSAKQNLLNAGLSQLQQTSMNDKANSQKASMDKYTLGLMSQIFPNLKYYNQFDQNTIDKQLGR